MPARQTGDNGDARGAWCKLNCAALLRRAARKAESIVRSPAATKKLADAQLRQLAPLDSLQILVFHSTTFALFKETCVATRQNLDPERAE